jgi:adenosyl cobinamide kinase/adenosyl cobinamide phosphate guanylyltransferase
MILITGGVYQGKHEFANSLMNLKENQSKITEINDNLYSIIENCVKNELNEADFENTINNFANDNKNNIIITLDVGSCLISVDKYERTLKKYLGKANIILAQKADSVYRICCSLGMKLK